MVGAFSATWLARRVGSARVIWLALGLSAPFALLIPLTFPGLGLALYAGGAFVMSLGAIVYNVNQASFRQLLCPDRLLGRVNATMRFVVWGTLPVGGLLGGALGGWLGNRDGLWVAVAGIALSPLWLLASPLRGMRDLLPPKDPGPAPADGEPLGATPALPLG